VTFDPIGTTTETFYLVEDLTPGTTYDFRVQARNEYGYSDMSGQITVLVAYIAAVPENVVTTIEGS
jgi:hypothetical protein